MASAKTAKKTARKAVTVKKKKTASKKAASTEELSFHPKEHVLVPTHEVLTEKEIQAFYEQYDIQPINIPTIYIRDAALKGLDVKIGDIIRVSRKSLTAGDSTFYRRVAYE